jgi:ribose 5-phosphate isomerase B
MEVTIMKIAIACDHSALELKEEVKKLLLDRGLEYEDFGTYTTDSCHYPIYGARAAKAVADGRCDLGIVICGTGIGISMTANKVKGIRCALCSDTFSARMTRIHNDSNMLALGARVIGVELAKEIVNAWLDAEFEGGRHQVRIDMITALENGECIE